MAVVSNSSPLILYAKVEHLGVLQAVFTEILIPPAVYDEIARAGVGRPGAAEISSASWVTRRRLQDPDRTQLLLEEVHRGEAEVIALATELGSRLAVLIDDRNARRLARRHGLRVYGSAGTLILAKERGIIPQVRPLLDALRAADLHLSEATYREVLTLAGE